MYRSSAGFITFHPCFTHVFPGVAVLQFHHPPMNPLSTARGQRSWGWASPEWKIPRKCYEFCQDGTSKRSTIKLIGLLFIDPPYHLVNVYSSRTGKIHHQTNRYINYFDWDHFFNSYVTTRANTSPRSVGSRPVGSEYHPDSPDEMRIYENFLVDYQYVRPNIGGFLSHVFSVEVPEVTGHGICEYGIWAPLKMGMKNQFFYGIYPLVI